MQIKEEEDVRQLNQHADTTMLVTGAQAL